MRKRGSGAPTLFIAVYLRITLPISSQHILKTDVLNLHMYSICICIQSVYVFEIIPPKRLKKIDRDKFLKIRERETSIVYRLVSRPPPPLKMPNYYRHERLGNFVTITANIKKRKKGG